jgi:hypothetical protein
VSGMADGKYIRTTQLSGETGQIRST